MGTLAPDMVPGQRSADNDAPTMGKPDGPVVYVDYLDMEVGTFTDPRKDLYIPKDSGTTSLMHHVPFRMRGPYVVKDLPETFVEEHIDDLRIDEEQWVICGATTQAGNPCRRKAMNRSNKCAAHGGKLHPLDKKLAHERMAMPGGDKLRAAITPELEQRMTRHQKFLSGLISVDDLDDEELAKGGFREADGRIWRPRRLPREFHQKMVDKLFERAGEKLKENLLDVVDTMTDIAKGSAYEPADRLKAAQFVIERVMGKNPDVVVHQQDKPWQVMLSGIKGGTREESRARRAAEGRLDPDVVDAEVVDYTQIPGNEVGKPGAEWDNGASTLEKAKAEIVPVDELLLPVQSVIPNTGDADAPRDPELRDKWEREQAAERERKEAAVKELKENLRRQKAKRIASRNRGFDTTEWVPLKVVTTKGENGEWHHRFVEPSAQDLGVSAAELNKKRRSEDYGRI